MKRLLTLLIFVVLLLGAGCSKYVRVNGKITFPDGQPLTAGEVIFTDDVFAGRAVVRSDGTFRMGRIKDGDGIPRGIYKVYLSGATSSVPSPNGGPEISTLLVSNKYLTPETSGLTCTVEGATVFDFTVEKP